VSEERARNVEIRSPSSLTGSLWKPGSRKHRTLATPGRGVESKIARSQLGSGSARINIAGNSTLSLPEGYVYLDAANTAKFEELNKISPAARRS